MIPFHHDKIVIVSYKNMTISQSHVKLSQSHDSQQPFKQGSIFFFKHPSADTRKEMFKENSVLPLFNSYFQKAIFLQTRHMIKWLNSPSHTDFLQMNHVNHQLLLERSKRHQIIPLFPSFRLDQLPSQL